MFDTHHDLLTKLYMSYLNNDFSFIEEWVKNYRSDNVRGLIANLYFMTIDEMKEECGENYYKDGDSVVEMFRISSELLKKYIPSDTLVLKSIEGCDYINVEDLEELKKLGLNSIMVTWNNKNKYGSGIKSDSGLTELGEKLISKAVELNIGIDLSHANERTFWDIVNYIKNNNLKANVYATHSNVRTLCDRPRNLKDEQIKAIGELGGFVSVMSHSGFVETNGTKEREKRLGTDDYLKYTRYLKERYVEHLKYVQRITGTVDAVCVSTDDMSFLELPSYSEGPLFNYSNVNSELRELLKGYYSDEEVEKIVYGNAYSHLKRLLEK